MCVYQHPKLHILPHGVQQTAIISLYNINLLIFITETDWV
jgi:hypothetical protein